MIFDVHAILDGLEDCVKEILITVTALVFPHSPSVDHASLLEQSLVLMETLPFRASVPVDLLATPVQKTLMNAKKIHVEMVETAPIIIIVDLSVPALRDMGETLVI